MNWLRRFRINGVFWRQLLRFGTLTVPIWIEPVILAWWSGFFLLWGPGRRGVMQNLSIIKPGSSAFVNFFRTYRVFWNFAWTITDNVRFKEHRTAPDWTFKGLEHFDALRQHEGGAIILTAHMGNYDLGAHLFAEVAKRKIVMVRAPETDSETQAHEQNLRDRTVSDDLSVGYSGESPDLAIDLLHALNRGEMVAIQGDRVVGGVAGLRTELLGSSAQVPAGPFALAMASGAPIFPLFVVRAGRRHYALIVGEPFHVERNRDRHRAFSGAVAKWTGELESAIRTYWFQWFTFEPFAEDAE